MPVELWNFVLLFLAIAVVFVLLKRPLYEAMAVAFLSMLCFTGKWLQAFNYLKSAAQSSILFTIIMFLLFSSILKKTGVIDDCIDIILAVVGKIPGGAGLVSIATSAFMGAMSGSGPGNVAATGSVTIPMMKKAGYPSEFAAGVAMAGSCMGPIIPPSATIISSFACLVALTGYEEYSFSKFWVVMYGVSLIFLIQRVAQMYIMSGALKIKRCAVQDLPNLKDSWKKGWKSFLIIAVILLPFILDNSISDWLAARLGKTSASHLSSSILIFTPAIASLYSLIISRKKFKPSLKNLSTAVSADRKSSISLVVTLFLSYAISALLTDCKTVAAMEAVLASMHTSYMGMTLILVLAATVLGMFMPGTAMIPLLGPVYITLLSAYGVNPVIVAAILPVLFVSLGQMTPPFAVCMYAAMGIAQSDFKKTCVQAIIWSIAQFVIVFLIIGEIVPVPWL